MDANIDKPGSEPLPNIRHERFCQIRAAGEQQTRAYVKAGYQDTSSAEHNASRLAATDKIRNRLISISAEIADKGHEKAITVTRDTLDVDAKHVYDLAEEAGNHTAMNAALVTRAKLRGLLTDKLVTETDNAELTAERESDARLYAKLRMSPQWDALVASLDSPSVQFKGMVYNETKTA